MVPGRAGAEARRPVEPLQERKCCPEQGAELTWCGNEPPLMMPNSLHDFPFGAGRGWVMAWDFVNYLVNDSQL